MDIVIDFSAIFEFMQQPFYVIAWQLLILIGWIPIVLVFLWGASQVWLQHIRRKWGVDIKFVLLAIDIPRGNEQSPKAVENMFSYLGGAHASLNIMDKWWEGKYQLSFSYEIVSIEGYTQFLIRTPASFRDLVESSVYSQYPDAEITEVNDYIEGMPDSFPDDEYDIWGTEFILKENSAYPIKTYEEFEHKMGEPETHFKDPMASLMDLCSTLRKGEQLWYQIIIIPITPGWGDVGDKEVAKIMGEDISSSKNIIDKMGDGFISWIGDVSEFIYELWGNVSDTVVEEKQPLKMIELKPHQKKKVEAIYEKVAKLGFKFKIRMVYMAKKDVMNKPKVLNGFVGYMKQFMALDLNNLKPDMDVTATSTAYFMRERRLNWRKNNIVRNYIARDDWAGRLPGLMNIEELATIWHFPVERVVSAPLIQKAEGKKAKPPSRLPVGDDLVSEELARPAFLDEEEEEKKPASDGMQDLFKVDKETIIKEEKIKNKKSTTPGNLPFV